jgi:glycosyltransferase involved in cell wall biosynthesis
MGERDRPEEPLLSVVVPLLDEEGCVEELVERITAALARERVRLELLLVDDGSRDRTPQLVAQACERHPERIKAIHFTRSFGHQAALTAGLEHARGDIVITMDADLQHPPELLPDMIERWRHGADVVHAVRRDPEQRQGTLKSGTSRLFYQMMPLLTDVPIIPAAADFRLLDRRVVRHFLELQEHFVFLRGLVPWLGFAEARVEYELEPRFAGETKYGWWRMLRLGLNAVFSFSVLPLRIITLLGIGTTLLGVIYGAFAFWAYVTGHIPGPSGWTSLMGVMLIFGGVQMLSLGIVSEYLGRVYEEVKRRPRYVIDEKRGLDEAPSPPTDSARR